MEEKEVTPVRLRKLKKMDEYREKIPTAWRFYQRRIEEEQDPRKAELEAVKQVYPGDRNSSITLQTWKKYGLWPPSKEFLEDIEKETARATNSRNQPEPRFKVIQGNGGDDKLTKKSLKRIDKGIDLSEKEILQMVRKILDTVEVHHKEWTGGRMKKYSLVKTRVLAGRLPVDLLNEIHKFKGSKTYHLERALRLYVKVMQAKG